ncbi:16S rRNA (guanine(966)-N(2))-methyltransferase RsmD [Rickettsia endosymbiont of Polydrusus tereticollis]|uniref:16S rRNA (guanine(966)-N(2))-methyltransferase RsmD n=1 Tax=Rickettsia endosymbiont of Polydrusus tereticollis TaxID=3066251 RepID=UPI003133496E
MLKIIAGKYKNRLIPTLEKAKYRPSTGKFREALFSILSSGEFIDYKLFANNINVLDLFSGSGSLAFEALSRGVGTITLIDANLECLRVAKEFAKTLGEVDKAYFVNINALILPKANKVFDLVFIDPPYYNNIVPKVMKELIKNNWLKNGSIIVIEMSKTDNYILDKDVEILKDKVYGKSRLLALKYSCEMKNG